MSPVYAERASRLSGAVVWTRGPEGGGAGIVLPDGCMDLLWTEGRLLVAGPDTRAYRSAQGPWVGVRFFPGTAPGLLGVPAHELRDRRVELGDLWSGAEVRRLIERVDAAVDPAVAIEELALRLAGDAPPSDPVLRAVVASLGAGRSVSATAESVGLGARQLHRLALGAFGYGPKTLARILRMQRALALARSGVSFAETAVLAGFADQAHLARDVRALTGQSLSGLVRS
ncbi:helix-turn-helix domain-containing protein [Streptomyces abikoensis]|uniref:helix-turn-helix domain-containing protein n=1 Tax=Streptomyces abikoensis TaxID=97398 RepID=UPI0016754EE3|nr:helix-turn-helix domain-containing protein [Streptomyces abikoensis]GGP78479.1 AraC family transcriptional regulator [Streptomyces abikoensis]